MIHFIKNLFTRKYTKEEVLGFKNYWQSRQSWKGYPGEDEKLFKEWLKQKVK